MEKKGVTLGSLHNYKDYITYEYFRIVHISMEHYLTYGPLLLFFIVYKYYRIFWRLDLDRRLYSISTVH